MLFLLLDFILIECLCERAAVRMLVLLQAATQAVVATQRLVSPEKRLSRILGHSTPDTRSPENQAAKPISNSFDGQPLQT